ncbi:hypothetical protein SMACR_03657 [Sordaria macrospora]|uniref:Mannan endo-1,6-alpha-mannosidase n=2 Tax=Sordaria macrospora TaxID=5147 RepID=F7VVT4_SORMK|nr:uncharacterized protein SMAC_03657 [Sordaria macrospora k-hell]KAA8635127.1 hypothetical protein SMACR_03657 [Sordaria macrospora]KAH7625738.1 glycosyl hydrolase family 76-domain-containing protein [Sordaria sp. MPI-SDFR-AT-0083]WPJ66052.1 hypothetical protein SMAC4_03657 [Sordaria macrospora]CCC09625.1 unnamed protein product [Sordaria macrospora k-hell]
MLLTTKIAGVAPLLLAAASSVYAATTTGQSTLQVNVNDTASIKTAAKTVAKNLISYYSGDKPGQTIGILPGPPPAGPYYWWEAGAMWGTIIDYWHYTGDDTYNTLAKQALVFQADPPQNSFMSPNWTASLGNDDQGFWGLSAMLAAEVNLPLAPGEADWLEMAQAVFNTQAADDRHDDECGGGLRWQIFHSNAGYDYKNTIANACFFNLGARLARYTDNSTYSKWAEKTYNWIRDVGYIDKNWNIYDGGHVPHNCTDINKVQWSANAAIMIHGVAIMYNMTEDAEKWGKPLTGLVNRTLEFFFPKGVMVERACELSDRLLCNVDQHSFKGYLLRSLATAALMAPDLVREPIIKTFKTNIEGVIDSCLADGTCGYRWNVGKYDGDVDNGPAGQGMSALAAFSTYLITEEQAVFKPLVTNSTGGESRGNPNAGEKPATLLSMSELTGKDKAGAGVLTAFVVCSILGTYFFLVTGVGERK